MELSLTYSFPLESQVPKLGRPDTANSRTIYPQPSDNQEKSPFSFGISSLTNDSDTVAISAATQKLLQENSELLRIIGEDEDLTKILQGSENSKKIAGSGIFLAREDLENVIIQGALNKLEDDTPITDDFLENNIGLAKLIARDIGGIAEILNDDDELAESLVDDENITGATIINNMVAKVKDSLDSDSPISENFLRNNLEATIYLAANPEQIERFNNSKELARDFQDNFSAELTAQEANILTRAGEILDFVAVYSDDFLERNYDLAKLVVASELNGDDYSLANFLLDNRQDVTDSFRTRNFTDSYEVELANRQMGSDFTMPDNFFTENRGMVLAVLGSEELVEALQEDKEAFNALFGTTDDSWEDKVTQRVAGTSGSSYEKGSSLSSLIDLFA